MRLPHSHIKQKKKLKSKKGILYLIKNILITLLTTTFRAVNELNETELKGQTLQARLTERRSPRRAGGAGMNSMGNNVQRHIEFPLRILVQSDMVGAIIGRGGQTIRQITQQTRYVVFQGMKKKSLFTNFHF